MTRLTFLSHFVICLAIAAGFYFAWRAGVPQMVAANDVARWFGGVIGALFVGTAGYLGWQAWTTDSRDLVWARDGDGLLSEGAAVDASFGHLMQLMFPSIGMLGTVVGLRIAFLGFANGGTEQLMAGGATAFLSTGCGILAMILTMVLTFNLESGIRRARR